MDAIPVPVREARDASYDVLVGCGVLAELPRLLGQRCAAAAYAVIADHKVAELHGAALLGALEAAGLTARLVVFPSGEWNKSREEWARLTDQLLAARIGRDGAIIAFGGGVAGDLAGFVAATYLRGVPWVQVPTTLLAMIDSSVGGKTGVDVPGERGGKNLVGAFHQPRFVLADISLLASLPRAHIAAGIAEAIKHGVIRDAAYFETLDEAAPVLAKAPARLEAVVRRSVEIKAAVVAADERESGERQVLNFGHTVGHAVEALSGFELLHGEAVAIGMAVEARLAELADAAAAGFARRIVALLEKYGLPCTVPEALAAERLLDVMRGDKKSRAGQIRFVLPQDIGRCTPRAAGVWTVPIEPQLIRQALDSCR